MGVGRLALVDGARLFLRLGGWFGRRRQVPQRDVRQIYQGPGVFQRQGDDIAIGIEVHKGIGADIGRLHNLAIIEDDVERIGFSKVANLHVSPLNGRSKKALCTVRPFRNSQWSETAAWRNSSSLRARRYILSAIRTAVSGTIPDQVPALLLVGVVAVTIDWVLEVYRLEI